MSQYGGPAAAEEAKKIQDNSFLLEEAYNQEDGVIQHIQSYLYNTKTHDWFYAFTQEWPVPTQKHQLSYTIPVTHMHEGDNTSIGDVALNYRYQLIMKGPLAVAPRFSMLLPTGDERKRLGTGALGYWVNLPVSVEIGEHWVTHWNAGALYTPNAKDPSGAKNDTWAYNLGASVICLAEETFNVMTEVVWASFEMVQPGGSKVRDTSFFVNPGVRFAKNYKSGLQIVPGLSFPIGIGSSHRVRGVVLSLVRASDVLAFFAEKAFKWLMQLQQFPQKDKKLYAFASALAIITIAYNVVEGVVSTHRVASCILLLGGRMWQAESGLTKSYIIASEFHEA